METRAARLFDHMESKKDMAWLVVGSKQQTQLAVKQFPDRPATITIWTHDPRPIKIDVWVYDSDSGRADREGEI